MQKWEVVATGGLTGNRVAPTKVLRLLPISSIVFDRIYAEVGSGSYGGLTGNRGAPTQALRLLPISSIIFDRDLCRIGKW